MPAEVLTIELDFRNQRFKKAEVGLNQLAKRLESTPEAFGPVVKKELQSFLVGVTKALAERHGARWYPGAKGPVGPDKGRLFVRSGRARKSILNSIRVTGHTINDLEGSVGGIGYLSTHEYGATIRPKKGKYLTIPLPEALNANGTPKKKSAREWERTFVLMSRNGNLIIMQKRGRKIVPLYLLVKEVKIPPRLGMGQTIRTGIPYFVDHLMGELLKTMVDKIGKEA